jgi:hypothetical protein
MNKRLAGMMIGLACMAGLSAVTTSVASASPAPSVSPALSVKPALCEHKCKPGEETWGAYEHAKAYAERYLEEAATVKSCSKKEHKEKAGEEQWFCQGTTAKCSWSVGMGPYGEQYGEFGYTCSGVVTRKEATSTAQTSP